MRLAPHAATRAAIYPILLLLVIGQIYSLVLQQLLAGIALVIGLLHWREISGSGLNRVLLAYLVFLVYRLSGALYSTSPAHAIVECQFPFFSLILLGSMAWSVSGSRRQGTVIRDAWLLAAAVACALAAIKYLAGFEARVGPPFGGRVVFADRAEGRFSTMAKFTSFTLLGFGPYLVNIGRSLSGLTRSLLVRSLELASISIGLFLTFSRSCWLATGVVYGLLTLLYNRKLSVLLLTLAVLALVTVPYARERVIQSFTAGEWSSGRQEVWAVAAELRTAKPVFGHGLGSFDDLVTAGVRSGFSDKGVGDWHNQYLQIYMESGVVGLLLFGWLFCELASVFGRMARQRGDTDLRNAGLGGLALLGGVVIIGLFEDYLSSPAANISFWLLLGFLLGWQRFARTPAPASAQT